MFYFPVFGTMLLKPLLNEYCNFENTTILSCFVVGFPQNMEKIEFLNITSDLTDIILCNSFNFMFV